MKIGFIVTAHYSNEYRPNGDKFLGNFITSLRESMECPYSLYIIDNGSSNMLTIDDTSITTTIRITDQTQEGITGAWNTGLVDFSNQVTLVD